MHTPSRLVACPTCACHYRAEEADCPHCGSTASGRPAAALMLGLALMGGCGKSVALYGAPITGPIIGVEITAPIDGAELDAGDLTVEATVSATDITDLTTLDVSWSLDGDAVCDETSIDGGGGTTCVVPLTAGEHAVSVEVSDPASGNAGGDAVTVTVGAGS